MNSVLSLLQENAKLTPAEIARLTGKSEDEIAEQVAQLERDRVILGYQAVVDPGRNNGNVTAFIEVKLHPERDGGFDRLAQRIAKFSQVSSCYLMSGGYDLVVVVHGDSLQSVAQFVAERLATIEGVTSTTTHFHLKTYKQAGFLIDAEVEELRLPVSP